MRLLVMCMPTLLADVANSMCTSHDLPTQSASHSVRYLRVRVPALSSPLSYPWNIAVHILQRSK